MFIAETARTAAAAAAAAAAPAAGSACGGALIGAIGVRLGSFAQAAGGSGVAELSHFCVAAEWRGCGIGRRLLQEVRSPQHRCAILVIFVPLCHCGVARLYD